MTKILVRRARIVLAITAAGAALCAPALGALARSKEPPVVEAPPPPAPAG